MAYRKIEEIVINGNSGEIFDSYIYGSNLELGYSESPTKLTLNIVKKDNTDFDSFPISLITSYEIKIGNLILSKMYLYSYEISRSVGQKVATLNFIDPSFILDKIFVGLIHRHFSPGNIDFTVTKIFRGLTPTDIEILSCNLFIDVDLKKGGSIMLGRAGYVNDQDTPDMVYNFTELLNAITKTGFNISGLTDINPSYFQTYTGTLREVLSNWCADFGYTFYWDITTNSIKGIDLKIEVDYINEIKSIINTNSALNVNITNENTLAIESFNEGQSLEGTITQRLIARYVKTTKKEEFSNTTANPYTFTCTTPERIGCTQGDVARAVLGKYSQSARKAYCLYWQDYRPLGYEEILLVEEISSNNIENSLLKQIVDIGYNNPAISQYLDKYNGAQVFIGIYNSEREQLWQDWDSSIADMIGKYYYGGAIPNSPNYSLSPSAQFYLAKDEYALPFAKVLEGPIASDLKKQKKTAQDEIKKYKDDVSDEGKAKLAAAEKQLESINEQLEDYKFTDSNVMIFTRDGAYGQDQNDYDAIMLDEKGEDIFSKYVILPLELEGIAYTYLVGAKNTAKCTGNEQLAEKIENLLTKIDALKDDKLGNGKGERKAVLALAPRKDALKDNISVQFVSDTPNPRENEKDEKEGSEYIGLKSKFARNLELKSISANRKINLILPVEKFYNGLLNIETKSTQIIPGQNVIYGKINKIDENTMSLNVIDLDITNDYENTVRISKTSSEDLELAVLDPDSIGSGINANSYLVKKGSAYYSDISKKIVNSITIPRKNITLSIIGLNYGDISNYFSQAKGLNSLSINLNENGATSQISFSNKPKILPKREALTENIKFAATRSTPSVIGAAGAGSG